MSVTILRGLVMLEDDGTVRDLTELERAEAVAAEWKRRAVKQQWAIYDLAVDAGLFPRKPSYGPRPS